MRATYFPEPIQTKAPEGTQDAVREAARQEGQSSSEFIRQAVRDRLRAVAAEQPAAGD